MMIAIVQQCQVVIPMGRKKSYNRDDLVGKAMEVFRDNGFAGTSAEVLVDHLEVNRYSIYAEFCSKQGLFDAALKRYDEEVLDRNFGPLEAPGAGIADIQVLFEFFGLSGESPAWGRGCFLCNTAVEFGPLDPNGTGFVERYFERVSQAFYVALENARTTGNLRSSVVTLNEAGFLTSSVLGLFVMLRAKAPSSLIKSAVKVAVDHLDNLQTGQ